MSKIQVIARLLKSQGFRITKIRLGLIQLIVQKQRLHTTTQILQLLRPTFIRLNKTTVYRELQFLNTAGIVRAVDLGDGKKRWEIAKDHHHHLVCTNCQSVAHVNLREDWIVEARKIAMANQFTLFDHQLELFGTCSNCQKNNPHE